MMSEPRKGDYLRKPSPRANNVRIGVGCIVLAHKSAIGVHTTHHTAGAGGINFSPLWLAGDMRCTSFLELRGTLHRPSLVFGAFLRRLGVWAVEMEVAACPVVGLRRRRDVVERSSDDGVRGRVVVIEVVAAAVEWRTGRSSGEGDRDRSTEGSVVV